MCDAREVTKNVHAKSFSRVFHFAFRSSSPLSRVWTLTLESHAASATARPRPRGRPPADPAPAAPRTTTATLGDGRTPNTWNNTGWHWAHAAGVSAWSHAAANRMRRPRARAQRLAPTTCIHPHTTQTRAPPARITTHAHRRRGHTHDTPPSPRGTCSCCDPPPPSEDSKQLRRYMFKGAPPLAPILTALRGVAALPPIGMGGTRQLEEEEAKGEPSPIAIGQGAA